jgi:hypothetical protein
VEGYNNKELGKLINTHIEVFFIRLHGTREAFIFRPANDRPFSDFCDFTASAASLY